MEKVKKVCSFVHKNGRECKFEVYENGEFCHHHCEDEKFVPCPIDPNHTVLKSRLEKHKNICPKKKEEKRRLKEKWFVENINKNIIEFNSEKNNGMEINKNVEKEKKLDKKVLQKLANEESDFLKQLIEKVEICYESALNKLKQAYNNNEKLLSTIKNIEITKSNIVEETDQKNVSDRDKDKIQVQTLIKKMSEYKLLQENFIFIEFGAGKGRFSCEVANTTQGKSGYILLEMAARRHKLDHFHRENKNYLRVRTDIGNFDAKTIPTLLPKFNDCKKIEIAGISKHMCGDASDLSLISLINMGKGNENVELNISGLCLATCCHHRCKKDIYVNSKFLQEIGFLQNELDYLFLMSSWAVTKTLNKENKLNFEEQNKELKRKKTEELLELKEKSVEKSVEIYEKKNVFWEKFNSESKTIIGFKVKRIIDIGRCLFLRDIGFEASLDRYCSIEMSPENIVILIQKKN